MALDHYVSRVHLKQFISRDMNGLMYAISKRDLKRFTPKPKDVCRIEEGSTNSYLRENRSIETFLLDVEPNYDTALANLLSGQIDAQTIYVLSGFLSYICVCSPTAMRLNSEPLKQIIEQTARILDAQKVFPNPPESLAGKSISSLLESSAVQVNVDPKYPQALGIAAVEQYAAIFGNSRWEILNNGFDDCPFFTSDYPAAVERNNGSPMPNRIMPLTPALAIRVCPNLGTNRRPSKMNFSNFRCQSLDLARNAVVDLNRLIVRCAENTVFFSKDHSWIDDFVKENARFSIQSKTQSIPMGTGSLHRSSLEVTETPKDTTC